MAENLLGKFNRNNSIQITVSESTALIKLFFLVDVFSPTLFLLTDKPSHIHES